MAACIVNITGTSGTLKLNYTLSAVQYSIETGIVPVGTLFIDSAATSVTYTTLSGDVIAAAGAGCALSITAAPLVCSNLSWDANITASGYVANGILLGSSIIPIAEAKWPGSGSILIDSINNANDDRVKVIGYKSNSGSLLSYSYILKYIGASAPQLMVRNSANTAYIYVPSILSSCTVPSDYTVITPCYGTLPTTTTTTAAPTTTTTTVAAVCDLYTVDISEKDIAEATGNTNVAYNNKVYITYTNCSNASVTNTYTVAGLQVSICVKAGSLPSYFHYQNNIQTSGTSVITLSGTC
jgi:hypothetical protein